ncbi:ADM [Parambassis ranga]|uniref:ADM n=1 Tax=Parambassis ranga TaxID=210632 RepID=A0A6P7KCQ4_9TELE|nr:ADM-like [Parambassis ranga]
MRLSLHTVICCCWVFTTVLPLVEGAPAEPDTSLRKRYREWLQSHTKRDLHNNLVAPNEPSSGIQVGPEQGSPATSVSPPLSFGPNVRPKRSTSGCALVTCLTHDLADRLHQIKRGQTGVCAPEKKMGSGGYGRRRRHSDPETTPQTGKQRCNTEDIDKHKSTEA